MANQATAETVTESTAPPKTPKEIFDEHFPGILEASNAKDVIQKELSEASLALTKALEKFKKAGGDKDQMKEALKLRKLTPQEIDRRFRYLNSLLKFMELPIGTQLGMFDQSTTIATAIENERLAAEGKGPLPKTNGLAHDSEEYLRRIEKDGYVAGINGLPQTSNPCPDGSPSFLRWGKGWREGDDARNFRAPGGGAPAERTPEEPAEAVA
jgi:ribosome modulation factor